MSDTVIAAQLYTVREFCKTPADFAKSMAKVSEIGYEAVQISGVGPMAAAEMRRICDGEGLKICATHVGFEALLNETAAQIDFHKTLGCENVAIGGLPASYRENGAGFLRFAKEATEVGRRLAAAGLTFSYHNHSFELEKFDGRLALDIIYEESDPGLGAARRWGPGGVDREAVGPGDSAASEGHEDEGAGAEVRGGGGGESELVADSVGGGGGECAVVYRGAGCV